MLWPVAPVRASDALAMARERGAAVFQKYCVLCHGTEGRGDGRAARLQQVRPADLTQSKRDPAYKLQIVSRGGAAMNRSASMPAWGEVLTGQEVTDVVAYLQVLSAASATSAQVAADTHSSGMKSP